MTVSNVTQASAEIPVGIVTAKGDIIAATASGAVINLAVGTSGNGTNGTYSQELLVDSTTSTGLRWGDDNLILTTMGALI